MAVGTYNARGATVRSEGGAQVRELAEKYRSWSKQVAFEHPKQDMFADDLQIMVDDVESALDGVAAISRHLDGGALSGEFQDKYQDPATRKWVYYAQQSSRFPSPQGRMALVISPSARFCPGFNSTGRPLRRAK